MTNPGYPDSPSSDSPYGQGSGYGQGHTYGEGATYGQSTSAYGQPGSGQPAYGSAMSPSYASGGAPACPPSNVGWAVAAILCFWPLSFVAMTRALDVYPLWAAGRQAEAEAASATAKKLGLISLVVVAAIFVLYFVFLFMMVGLATTY